MRMLAAGTMLALSAHMSANAQGEGDVANVQTVIEGQITSFRSRAHDKAFSYATPNLQRMFGSTERFIGMVRQGYGQIYGAQRWSFERSKLTGTRMFQEVRITGPKGREWIALYTMEQQADGSWRIGGVQIAPDNARTS